MNFVVSWHGFEESVPLNSCVRIGYLLLSFVVFPILLGYMQLMLTIPLKYPIGIIGGCISSSILATWNHTTVREFFTGSFIFFLMLLMSAFVFDFSYDGQAYHQLAAFELANGWNPFWDAPEKVNLWTAVYPKALWIYAGMWYSLTGSLLIGKVYNLVFLFVAIVFCWEIIEKVFTNNKWLCIVLLFLLVFNPVVTAQIFSYYNDGTMYLLILLLASLVYLHLCSEEEETFGEENNNIFIVGLLIVLCNVKFTGFIYACVFALGAVVAIWLKRKNCLQWKSQGMMLLLGIVLGGTVMGFNPYVTNMVRHGHPFWPLMGKDTVDIITTHEHPEFQNHNRFVKVLWSQFAEMRNFDGFEREEVAEKYGTPKIKMLGAISIEEIHTAVNYDTRIGGFGPWFNMVLVLCFFILSWGAYRRIFTPMEWWILFIVLGSVLLNPECWIARYVPQFYLFPILPILFCVWHRLFSSLWIGLLLFFLIVNSGFMTMIGIGKQVAWEYRYHKDIFSLQEEFEISGEPFYVYFSDFPMDRITCFERYDIPYIVLEEDNVPQKLEPRFLSGTNKKVMIYECGELLKRDGG